MKKNYVQNILGGKQVIKWYKAVSGVSQDEKTLIAAHHSHWVQLKLLTKYKNQLPEDFEKYTYQVYQELEVKLK